MCTEQMNAQSAMVAIKRAAVYETFVRMPGVTSKVGRNAGGEELAQDAATTGRAAAGRDGGRRKSHSPTPRNASQTSSCSSVGAAL